MALFKTIAEFRTVFPLKLVFQFEHILPNLESAEEEYLAEQFLGAAQYQELHTAYQADTLSPAQEALLERCRKAIAPLAVYHYTGLGNVNVDQGGFTVASTDKYVPASEWRTRDLERDVLRLGYRALDVLQKYLTENASSFPTYEASTNYTELRAGFIRGTADVDSTVRIGNSGHLYRKMLPAIRRIEQQEVLDTLCSSTYRDDLLTKLNAATLSADEAKVVDLVKHATAHLAMASSIVELALGVSEDGVWTVASLVGGQTSKGKATASDERLNARVKHEQQLGANYLARLTKELQAQAEADEDHPYRTSTCYVDPTETVAPNPDPDAPVGNFL